MSKTMRAYQLREAGKMPQVVEVPLPEPRPGQVRLRTAGAGLCHSDFLVFNANPSYYPLPMTMGHEATGWVDAVGSGVEGLTIGDAYGVYFAWGCGHCTPCARGAENICHNALGHPGFATGRDGGMADYILVDSPRHLVPLGDADPIEAAPLMCAGITTYHAVEQAVGRLTPGTTATVIGIGGLGHIAIQILKALTPARVIAVDTQPEKLEQARALGADLALLSGPDTADAIRADTKGLGSNVVLDFVGNNPTLALGARILGIAGLQEIVGVGGGTLPVNFFEFARDSSITLPYAGTISDLRGVVSLFASGLVHPEVSQISFDQLNETYELMDSGKLKGRAVLVPALG